jgi:hypothetical protein
MKTTIMEKKAERENGTSTSARHVRVSTRRDAQTTLQAALDRQVAEIERTFTIRYEW